MFDGEGSPGTVGDGPPGAAGDGPPDAVAGAVDVLVGALSDLVDVLGGEDPAGLDLAGQLGRLRAVGRLIDRLEAERVRLLGAADRSGALSQDGAATAAAWLRRHSSLTANQAAQRARLVRRLRELPVIAAAFAAGGLGVAQVVQIDRLAADVGVEQVAEVQAELVTAAGRLRDVGEFTRLCAGWRHALRPDVADGDDDRAYERRRLHHSATWDGEFHLSGVFDAEGGATIAAALNAYMHHDPPGTPPELRRSVQQRRADAMVAIGRAALGCADAPRVAGAKPRVVVRVDLADLVSDRDHRDHQRLPGHRCCGCRGRSVSPPTVDWAGPIGPAELARLVDDAVITRVVFDAAGQPLDVGAGRRVWPAAIRAAITERDRGCRFDPCDRPAEWCDIDHVVPFCEGGVTAVGNGILLCRHHHRAKRRDGWWPILHGDGTVVWTHADGRTRTDPPPRVIDDHVRTLLHAGAAATVADHAAAAGGHGGDGTRAGRSGPHRGRRLRLPDSRPHVRRLRRHYR
jgi:hypothetical protein